jgi:hypothetical protein
MLGLKFFSLFILYTSSCIVYSPIGPCCVLFDTCNIHLFSFYNFNFLCSAEMSHRFLPKNEPSGQECRALRGLFQVSHEIKSENNNGSSNRRGDDQVAINVPLRSNTHSAMDTLVAVYSSTQKMDKNYSSPPLKFQTNQILQ